MDDIGAPAVADVLAELSAEGARLLETRRSAELVVAAMRRLQFVPQL